HHERAPNDRRDARSAGRVDQADTAPMSLRGETCLVANRCGERQLARSVIPILADDRRFPTIRVEYLDGSANHAAFIAPGRLAFHFSHVYPDVKSLSRQ